MSQQKILGSEQVGFCHGKSTLDHCVVLSHLINKYTKKGRSRLFTAFLDLKGAFDSIPRELLWDKLYRMNIDKRLLSLIRQMYTSTSCQIKCSLIGKLTPKISTNKGVKQGCILAPCLFNLFLNDLAPTLSETAGHSPRLGTTKVPLLFYADDVVLLSRTRVGLKRLLKCFAEFCTFNSLELNYEKSKILVFSRPWKSYLWKINDNQLEQVKTLQIPRYTFSL